MNKISKVDSKESSYFESAKKIYPALKDTIGEYDFWIRRKSLISTSGVLLLFLGIISLFWSYLMINLYYFENKFASCDATIVNLLNINSFFIFIGNVPLFIVVFILLLIKTTSFISAYICPSCLITSSKLCQPKVMKLQYVKNFNI